jgi:putative Mg2+ transporter-C (MgtC) family protein
LGEITTHIVSLAVAYALAFPVGWIARDARRRHRTFPLVAIASCGFVLVGVAILGRVSAQSGAAPREGLITGVGFIGGGAILKGGKASGTATAADL